MTLTRRAFAAASAALLVAPRALAGPPTLTARPASHDFGLDGAGATPVWAYNGMAPGPEIRAPQGGRISRRFVNELPQPSTIHWHGVRIDARMDGVPGLSQPVVEPGARFDYDFAAPDAGTFWYHPHNRTFEQAARGLYGPLIVEEAAPPEVDADLVLMLDDWRLARDGRIAEDFGSIRDASHAGRIGNLVTVNAAPVLRGGVRRHERLRLRLVNAANARIFRLGFRGLSGWVVALDGQPLAAPEALETVTLAPAQRADLIVDVRDAEEALIGYYERDGAYALVEFPVAGAARGEARTDPPRLPPNPLAPVDPAAARAARLSMEGGAMGGLRAALLDGKTTGMREMAGAGKVWAFNGRADMPETPFLTAARGEHLRIEIVNDTAWPHAMHLHGHHFREIGDGGLGPWRDTILLDRAETREIAFVADNPGDWLLHCHMLEHAAAGMMTWLRVEA